MENNEKKMTKAEARRGLRAGKFLDDPAELGGLLVALGCGEEQAKIASAEIIEAKRKGLIPTRPDEEPEWPPLSPEDTELIGKMSDGLTSQEVDLLSAMVRCSRARPHPTGRIRYGDDELMKESRIKSKGEYRSIFASLASKGLVKCAVVGSKNPVTTIELPWLPKEDK